MEKMLTVLVPIHGDEDFIVQAQSMPTVDTSVPNKIYLYEGIYYRRIGDTIVSVTDVEFPEIGRPLELFEFTYSATRMSTAPTITASTKWYAEEDEEDHLFYNLDGKWTQECHVEFKGQKYYLRTIPTSSKDNEDARFKYDIEFVSHWKCLERVYMYDVAAPYITERQLNGNSVFSFFGDITELRKRINASLVKSGLSSYRLRPDITDYFTYSQWNNIPLGTQSDPHGYYQTYQGNYTLYLQNEVFVYENGEFVIDGYQVIIDEGVTSEEKMISFDKNFIYDALQKICDKENGYGLMYYYKHGTKEIHIGDCEYDFGEDNAVSYGRYKELLSIKKTNNTERVINRMTGVGSEENIPYYYPNPTADGWLKSVYERANATGALPEVVDAQPSDIYPSAAANAYERFLKNRLGYRFEYGNLIGHIYEIGYSPDISSIRVSDGTSGSENVAVAHYYFTVSKQSAKPIYLEDYKRSLYGLYRDTESSEEVTNAALVFGHNVTKKSAEGQELRFRALLRDVTTNTIVGQYDSENYDGETADDFAKMCHDNTMKTSIPLTSRHTYDLSVYVYLDEVPIAEKYDFEGYYYPYYHTVGDMAIIVPDFYQEYGLVPGVANHPLPMAMYVRDNTSLATSRATQGHVVPRVERMIYKDKETGVLYKCINPTRSYESGHPSSYYDAYEANPVMGIEEFVINYLDIDIKIYNEDGWYLNGRKVNLEDYGMTLEARAQLLDAITFKRLKYITPQKSLMPEIYIKTDGERRYYNAINYPYSGSNADTDSGEYINDSSVHNSLYKDDQGNYLFFENPYNPQLVSEDTREYDDIKPSIKGMTNTVDGDTFRIDVAAEYAYDELDDDSIWETGDDGNIEGEYKHPHFFIKLRQLPFNIFDMAMEDDMEISITSGKCGSCTFKIKVDENTKKNPVQVWEDDVYTKDDTGRDSYTLYASAGSLKRYTTKTLYTREQKRYIDESGEMPVTRFYYEYTAVGTRWNSMYTADAVVGGLVGSLNTENHSYMEGDVVTRGIFQDSQQDTSTGEVWIALEKDTDTFGMLMPAALPTYSDETFSVYVRPASVADTGDEDTADTFVITNIKMPQYYFRYAEKELSKAIIRDMDEGNAQRFNFSMYFSRIFIAENSIFATNLTENAVLYAEYNNKKYKQYVKSFVYKMNASETLPDITVEMDDELSVVFGGFEESVRRGVSDVVYRQVTGKVVTMVDSAMQRKYIKRSGTSVVFSDIISKPSMASIAEGSVVGQNNVTSIEKQDVSITENEEKIKRKADTSSVQNDLSIIRQTLEYRFATDANCGTEGMTEKVIYDSERSSAELYWLTADGTVITHSTATCAIDPWIYGKNNT